MRIPPKVWPWLAVGFTIGNVIGAAIAWRAGEMIHGSIHAALAALGGWWYVWLRRSKVVV